MGATLDDVVLALTGIAERLERIEAKLDKRPMTNAERQAKHRQDHPRNENRYVTDGVTSERETVTNLVTPRARQVAISSSSSTGDDPGNTSLVLKEEGSLIVGSVTKRVTLDPATALRDAMKRGLTEAQHISELEKCWDYWDARGWKSKGTVMKNENAVYRSWLDSPYRNGNGNGATAHPSGLQKDSQGKLLNVI